MKKHATVLILFSLFLFLGKVNAQITKQQADNLVLNQVLNGQLESVEVFCFPTLKSGTAGVEVAFIDEVIPSPYENYFLYFVDDNPYALWSHNCRYIFVNPANGEYSTVAHTLYPKGWKHFYEELSILPPNTNLPQQTSVKLDESIVEPNPHLYAVLIVGEDTRASNNDLILMYNTLVKVYGYPRENIFIHYGCGYSTFHNNLDGVIGDDISMSNKKSAIHQTFLELAGESNLNPNIPALGREDQLFVYVFAPSITVSGYGSPSYYLGLTCNEHTDDEFDNGGYYTIVQGFDFVDYTKNIPCAQLTYFLNVNFSQNYVEAIMNATDPFLCNNKLAVGPTDDMGYVYLEGHITDRSFTEFTYYWAAAMRGGYPNIYQPWQVLNIPVGSYTFTNHATLQNHPGDFNADTNSDGKVSMDEAFHYAKYMDTWCNYYYYNPIVEIPLMYSEQPLQMEDAGLPSSMLSLNGYSGVIEENYILSTGNYVLSGNLSVANSAVLSIAPGTNISLTGAGTGLLVEEGSILEIGEGCSFIGGNTNALFVDGLLTAASNLTFSAISGSEFFEGLVLNNRKQSTILNNCNFTNTGLSNLGKTLEIENSTFHGCGTLSSYRGDVRITGSQFSNSGLLIDKRANLDENTFELTNNTFSSTTRQNAVTLQNYSSFFINGNFIAGFYNGLQVFYSGQGTNGPGRIMDNYISNCTEDGLLMYSSSAEISNNTVFNNRYGIRLMDRSNVALFGNPNAQAYSQTQQLRDNLSYELYASENSFPYYFKYNVILDEDNNGAPADPLVYYFRPDNSPMIEVDVTDNCWGAYFNPVEDLYGYNCRFSYDPIWRPGKVATLKEEAVLFENAQAMAEQTNYQQASGMFKYIVQNHPQSEYAPASMKELLRIEPLISSNLENLKQYYLTNETILMHANLGKLGDFLSNLCDVKSENWLAAIEWYESKILNPETLEERIFAEIDLGYTYFLMENSANKAAAAVTGMLRQHKYETVKAYNTNRDYLLSLLPGEAASENVKQELRTMDSGTLLQNYPNPFSQSTTIWYKTDRNAQVQLVVFDMTGKEVARMNEGNQTKGTHSVEFTNSNLSEGIYFYTLTLDGQRTDSKKMNVVR